MSLAPMHSVVEPVHMNVHAPPAQTWSRPHALPHAPQFMRSVWSDTQRSEVPASPELPQSVSLLAQSGTQALFWQVSPVPHARLQAPQFCRSLRGSVHRPLQLISGAGHTTASDASTASFTTSFVVASCGA